MKLNKLEIRINELGERIDRLVSEWIDMRDRDRAATEELEAFMASIRIQK